MRTAHLTLPLLLLAQALVVSRAAAEGEAPEDKAHPRGTGIQTDGDFGVANVTSSAGPSVNLRGALGYAAEKWDVGVRARNSVFEDDGTRDLLHETLITEFGVGGSYDFLTLGENHFGAAVDADAAFYTSHYFSTSVSLAGKPNENSDMARFTAFASMRSFGPTSYLVQLGLGRRFDTYSVHPTDVSDPTVKDETIYSNSFTYRARGRFRKEMSSDFALRLTTDWSLYSADRVTWDGSSGGFARTQASTTGVEGYNRAYAELTKWSFAGIVPAAFIGVDVLLARSSAAGGDVTSVAPVLGVGFMNW